MPARYIGEKIHISSFHAASRFIVRIPQIFRRKVERKNGRQRWEKFVLLSLVVQNLRFRFPVQMNKIKA